MYRSLRHKRIRSALRVSRLVGVWAFGLTGWASSAFADPPDKPAQGHIYTSITEPDGMSFLRNVVAVDPQTGACKMIVEDGLYPRLSPDARTVAYWKMIARTDPDSPGVDGEVWVKSLQPDAEPHKVWAGDGEPFPCWTRDGKRLMISARTTTDKRQVFKHWLVDPLTSEAETVEIPATECVEDYADHSDLRLMLTATPRYGLYCLLSDNTRKTITGEGQSDYNGRLSPDEKRVLFRRSEGRTTKVCTADLDGQHVQVAFTDKDLTSCKSVNWSPDAKRLAIVLFDWHLDANGRKILGGDADPNYRIAIVDLDGGNLRELRLDRAVIDITGLDWR